MCSKYQQLDWIVVTNCNYQLKNKQSNRMDAQQKFDYRLCSNHTLMTTFVHFNQTQDMFITSGQQGQVNLYKINQSQKIDRLGYANVFNQAIICISWANCIFGSWVAVAGSKGSLVILRVDRVNGLIQKIKHLKLQYAVTSLNWYQFQFMLLAGAHHGKVYYITKKFQQWKVEIAYSVKADAPVYLSTSSLNDNKHILFVGAGQTLHAVRKEIPLTMNHTKQAPQQKNKKMHIKFPDQKIVGILSQSLNTQYFADIVVLTNKKLRIFQYNQYLNMIPGQISSLKNILQVDIAQDNFDRITWGWSQFEILLYSSNILKKLVNQDQKNGVTSKNKITSPVVFKRKLNGRWIRIKQ